MDFLYILPIFGAFVGGFALAALVSVNRRDADPNAADTQRLDYLAETRATLMASKDGLVYGVLTGSPQMLAGDMVPDPRTAIDSARFRAMETKA